MVEDFLGVELRVLGGLWVVERVICGCETNDTPSVPSWQMVDSSSTVPTIKYIPFVINGVVCRVGFGPMFAQRFGMYNNSQLVMVMVVAEVRCVRPIEPYRVYYIIYYRYGVYFAIFGFLHLHKIDNFHKNRFRYTGEVSLCICCM